MRKFMKRVMAGVLTGVLVFAAGCSPKESSQNGESQNAKGRYIEEEFAIPEEIESIMEIEKLTDGTLRMVSYQGIYDSKDGGSTWDPSESFPSVFLDEEYYVSSCNIDKSGAIIFVMMHAERMDMKYIYMDNDGSESEIPFEMPEEDMNMNKLTNGDSNIENNVVDGDVSQFVMGGELPGEDEENQENDLNSGETDEGNVASNDDNVNGQDDNDDIQPDPDAEQDDGEEYQVLESMVFNWLNKMMFYGDDKLVGENMMGKFYIIDRSSGEVINTIEPDVTINNSTILNDRLIVCSDEGVDIYDLTTGNLLDKETVLDEYFVKPAQDSNVSVEYGLGTENILWTDEAEDTLYFCDLSGLYRYKFGTSAVELLINGELNSMSNPGYYFNTMIGKDDGTFLVSMNSLESIMLFNYEYSDEVNAVPDKEIKVYSLEDNKNLRQAISVFQNKHTDYYINYEVGLSGEDSITVADALRTLNTNILAGNGPDILLMDGMDIDSIVEKGLLVDLKDTIQELKNETGFFENILNMYGDGDSIYAIPSRFSVPVIIGNADDVKDINSLADLADKAEELRAGDEEMSSIIGNYTPEILTRLLMDTSSESWMKEDGTLDEVKLKEFLEYVNRIYATAHEPEEIRDDAGKIDIDIYEFLMKEKKIGTFNIGSLSDYNMTDSLLNRNDNWMYKTFSGQSQNVYVPSSIMGINSKSDMVEDSLIFIKEMMGVEMQKISLAEGLPVNSEAYDSLCNEAAEAGTEDPVMAFFITEQEDDGITNSTMFDVRNSTKERYDEFKGYIEGLDTPANMNSVIRQAVIDEIDNLLAGSLTTEECLDKIMQTVNIYLAE